MKKLIVLVFVCASFAVNAENVPVPAIKKGSEKQIHPRKKVVVVKQFRSFMVGLFVFGTLILELNKPAP